MSTVNPVIRRSHKKSKDGCHNCKKRRIKCDEFRPDCRNCLLGRRTCKYPVTEAIEDTSTVLDNSWSGVAESSLQTWRTSGEPPFPFLQLPTTPRWHNLSLGTLKHMHHLALLASILELSNTRQFCAWWSEFPMFVQLALSFDFVAYAVIAHSAGRLALVTKTSEAFEDAARFRTLALKGLNEAINSFSKDNADAILCASMCLSNQEHDWRSWRVVMEGTSAVIQQMQPWITDSLFYKFVDYKPFPPERRTSSLASNPNTPKSPQDPLEILTSLLAQGITSLNILSSCSKDSPDLSAIIRQLRDTCRLVHSQSLSTPWSTAEQYRLTHPFAAWMDRYTISYVAISKGDLITQVTLAHFFAVVVVLDMVFPDIQLPLTTPIRLKSIVEAETVVRNRLKEEGLWCVHCRVAHKADELMKFPMDAVRVFRELRAIDVGRSV